MQIIELSSSRIQNFRRQISTQTSINAYLWICSTLALSDSRLHGSRGCLGCFPNPPVIKGQAMNKDNRSEDFWSSSAFEIDQSALRSQKSFSSIGIASDPQSSAGIQIDSPEYVNHGLLLWNQMRRQWVGNKRPENKKQVGEPVISWNVTYESLMGTNKPFPRPIPLGVSSCMHRIVSSHNHVHVHDRKWLTFLLTYGSWKACMTKLTNQGFFFLDFVGEGKGDRICSSYYNHTE